MAHDLGVPDGFSESKRRRLTRATTLQRDGDEREFALHYAAGHQ